MEPRHVSIGQGQLSLVRLQELLEEEQQQATGPILVNHAAVSRRTVKG